MIVCASLNFSYCHMQLECAQQRHSYFSNTSKKFSITYLLIANQYILFFNFQPILCYLEGMWTNSDGSKIDEPFESDRHFVDATSYFDLQVKLRQKLAQTWTIVTKLGLVNMFYKL